MKEKEWWKLREALKEQKEVMRRREEELCAEAQEMVYTPTSSVSFSVRCNVKQM